MPLKVRCPSCERILNVSDRARGKAVKCPDCGTAVRVPAAKLAKKAVAPPPSSSMAIANLDLDRLEDTATRICPKCSAEVSLEDEECPECHVNLATGTLSEKNRVELSRKGPNPKLYYKEFFSDSSVFWKKNINLSLRLAGFSAAFTALYVACLFVSVWSAKPLVRYFFVFLSYVSLLVAPGLAWSLDTTIIDATLRKKKKLGKYTFDKFLGVALSLRLLAWYLVIAAPVHLLALAALIMYLVRGVMPALVAAGALEVAAFVFASLLFPLASVHMAMPISTKGWLVHKMSKPFFRTFGASVYWCFFLYLLLIPSLACIAVGAVVSGKDLLKIVATSNENSKIFVIKSEIAGLAKNKELTKEQRDYQTREMADIDWSRIFLPAGMLILSTAWFGMTSVFLMRANGLYAHYFLDRLDLETMTKDIVYVPKAKTLDELEARSAGLSWKKVLSGVGLALILALAFGGAGAVIQGKSPVAGIGTGILIVGILTGTTGYFWLLYEAFMDSMIWFGAILITSQCGWVIRFFLGPAGWAVAGLVPFIYGAVNWSNAKYPLVIMVLGNMMAIVGVVVLVVSIGPDFLLK